MSATTFPSQIIAAAHGSSSQPRPCTGSREGCSSQQGAPPKAKRRESKPEITPTLYVHILHHSGKSTQPNCCVPYPAGCIVLVVIDGNIIIAIIIDITQGRGIWILQICNNMLSDQHTNPQFASTHQSPKIVRTPRALICHSAPTTTVPFSPLLHASLFINLSDFTLGLLHPQPPV
jgi:hypothetical protein